MRFLVILLALVTPWATSAQMPSAQVLGAKHGPLVRPDGVVLDLPLSVTGPLLSEDPGTVSHVYWNGTALVDTVGNAWTMNGTVPQVVANVSPFVPGKAGAGPYSTANNYQGPTTLGEWTGDWSVTVVFKPTSMAGQQLLLAKRSVAATTGWACGFWSGGEGIIRVHDGGEKSALTAINTVVLNAINVLTCGRQGGATFVRVNASAPGTNATLGTMTSAAASFVRIGKYDFNGASEAVTTTIYEILASTAPYSDALHAARFQQVFGQQTLQGQAVTVTRAEAISYTANGLSWRAPPAVAPIEATGMAAWKGAANVALQSQTPCVANAVQAPWGMTNATCVSDVASPLAPDSTQTIDEWTATIATGGGYADFTVTSTTSLTFSTWVSKATGVAQIAYYALGCTAPTCACARSDSGACTPATFSVTGCSAKVTNPGSIPVRLSVSIVCSAPVTGGRVYYIPGEWGVSTGTARFWGAQVETGLYPTPYIATVGTAVARAATVASTPLAPLGNRWCVSVTATPGSSWTDAGIHAAVTFGSSGVTPNTGTFYTIGTAGYLKFTDSAGVTREAGGAHGLTGVTTARLTVCNANGTTFYCVNGVTKHTLAGTGLWSATPATLGIGNAGSGSLVWDGNLRDLKICRGATKCAECP